MKTRTWTIVFVLISWAAVAEAAVSIVAAEAKRHDAGVSLAIEDLTAALKAGSHEVTLIYREPDAPLPPVGDVILVGTAPVAADSWKPDKPEGFRIRPLDLSGRRVLVVEGDQRGLMYGVFKLAERIRLGEELWQIEIESAPAFPMRMFSEEGQLLDIPDIGYYSDEPPYVDEKRLQREVDELKRLVDHVARLGFNALTILHLSFEEYIDYKYLDKEVYAPDGRHRLRSPVFCKYLKELCDYAHARHIDVYLQLYEIQYPPRLDELYGVDLDSPDMERIIRAKTRELFERVPLDGLVVTATETHPRCGYASKELWSKQGNIGAAKMLAMYHKACKAQGKEVVFRMWRIAGGAAGFDEVCSRVPSNAMLAIKNTGGDYYLSWPTTDVITGGAGKRQPLMVIFDTFREYDGWSRLFCYMKRWGEVVRACRDNGVTGINAWAAWSPGCIWPDWEPGYLRNQKKGTEKVPVSWAGHWNSFRMFTRGFTPGQCNPYLLGRLAWNPDADIEAIAREFAALQLGPANARAAAKALMATEDAFAQEYLGTRDEITHPCYIKWTMVFNPNAMTFDPKRRILEKSLEKAYRNTTLELVLKSNALGLENVRKMEAAFAKTDPAKAPDPKRYESFKEGIDKTTLFLRTFYLWRECWWRHRSDRDLSGEAKWANAAALRRAKARLMPLFDRWQKYPEEAGHWHITNRYGKPKIVPNDTFPTWYVPENVTMESTAAAMKVASPDGAPLAWPKITKECRPGAYWWWMGSTVNPADLTRELERYRAAGMGGVHVISIFRGAKGYENRRIEYLSPKWMAMLRHAVGEAGRLDMFVDMTPGVGWCYGGPNVRPSDACAWVDVKTFSVPAGARWKQSFDPRTLQALAAFSPDGKWLDLKPKLDRDGAVEWLFNGDNGQWQVYAVAQKPSGRPVKHAAPGGAGPMLNPFYGEAVRRYMERFTRAFTDHEGPTPRAIYHDSYEYDSNWSPDLLAEFAKRRGYRLEAELPVLLGTQTSDHAARVKSDYRETISDMMIENYAPAWIQWAHARGFKTRYQAHGSPANLLDLYAQADIPETETFNKERSIFASKFASSAAHVAGRKLVASETGTWLKEHFTETLADMKDLVDLFFLSGVNHIVYQGACYSPDEAGWPGWLFYASTQMNPRNSIWRDVPALNAYVARCQAVLQSGWPGNDVLLYWPIYDIWHNPVGLAQKLDHHLGGLVQKFTVHDRYWLEGLPVGEVSGRLWDRGYGFDYVSDRQLTAACTAEGRVILPGGKYRAIVIPPCEHMPPATLAALVSLAEDGATVVFADRLPRDVPGTGDLGNRRARFQEILGRIRLVPSANGKLQTTVLGKGRILVGPLEDALTAAGVPREPMTDLPGLQFIRREMSDGFFYFINHRGKGTVEGWVPLGVTAETVAIHEPMTGRIDIAALRKNNKNQTEVYLQLEPGRSIILRSFTDRTVAGTARDYYRVVGDPVDITGAWRVRFIQGGPELPTPFETTKLASWTKLGGKAAESFAGTACYTITFDAPVPSAPAWLIDLGEVCQSARVRLNGRTLGTVFTRPFRVSAGQLRPTGNVLEVEVTNVSANRIRDLDRRGVHWKNLYGVNLIHASGKPFNASNWPLHDSGLLGPVRLFRQAPVTSSQRAASLAQ